MKLSTAILAAFLVFTPTSFAQQGPRRSDVTVIDQYVRTVDAVLRKRKSPDLIFADTAGVEDEDSKWRKFPSDKALERFRKKTETYSISNNWIQSGNIVASTFTLFSPSGDWVKYLYHYFRPDGTLARIETDYRTFNGDFVVVRRRYFAADGKAIHETRKVLDLKTRKPKKATDGVMGDDPAEVDFYTTTAKLPYAHLIKAGR